ncbi:APC family permease [Alicyclobacillus tolerans]|uniref:APC family permease n=1 Tax=Alicyclobacillus tolerans TaxID=90970 RepID=UPI001F2117F8|nr:APC family permease [Alicyclobacillus tolerans]MCF8566613.1 APC family permease [Alicyclobacillus tolerans]
MNNTEILRPDENTAAAAYQERGTTEKLREGRLHFFRTIAQSVGVQGPTGGVVIGAAILAGISGGGTALVQLIAAIAMGFVAYAFVLFTRGFNSAGSVYGFTGAVVGPIFGFLSAWSLMLVYINFAGGVYASVADEAQPAFAAIGIHLPWQIYAFVAFVLVVLFAYLDIKTSSTIILVLEGVSMLLVTIVCIVILAKGGYHGHAFSSAPFRPNGASLATLGLGIVYSFSAFSGFESAATLGEESARPRKMIPMAVAVSLIVVAIFEIGVAYVVTNAFPNTKLLAASPVPLVSVTNQFVAPWVGTLVNFGAVVSSFGAALACVNGGTRMLFALGRDGIGPKMLKRVSKRTGSPVGALVVVSIVSLAFLVGFLHDKATDAVGIILTYGADLILAAYALVLIAAVIYTVKRRMSPIKTLALVIGLAILVYVVKDTFIPFPAAPYNWDAYGAVATLVIGLVIPLLSRRIRNSLRQSPLLKVGAVELLKRESQRS